LPEALLDDNQLIALGGVSALLSGGLAVPAARAMSSIDDSIDTSQLLVPTTVDFSAEEAARQALQLGRRRLIWPGSAPIHARIAPSLIVRMSSIRDLAK
jgi:DNA-binding LacI/PurR family transcriptional regulator